ncbi:MAG: hypothetical protein AB7G87_13060 [Clostridia bacterium]
MDNYKVLVISYSTYEYDGRLRELVEIAQLLGETYLISKASNKIFENHFIYNKSDNYFIFLQFCYQVAKMIPDLSIVIADNRKALIPGQFIKRIVPSKIWTISDSRELYIIKDVKHITGKIGCIIEKFLYKKYDLLICANRERARIAKKLYNLTKEPLVYENIRKLDYSLTVDLGNLQEKFKYFFSNDSIKIVSTAGYSLNRGGIKLIEEVGSLGDKFSLFIIGGGKEDEKKKFNSLILENGINNIFDVGRLNSDELKYFIRNCDIGAVFYHKQDLNNRYCASGKVYEFIFEGLPIVCTSNIPLKRFCKQYQVGISGDSFSDSIMRIVDNMEFFRSNIKKMIDDFDIIENRSHIAHIIKTVISVSPKDKNDQLDS